MSINNRPAHGNDSLHSDCAGREESESFVESCAEVGQGGHYGVDGDGFGGGADGADFGCETAIDGGVGEDQIGPGGEGDGGCFGAGAGEENHVEDDFGGREGFCGIFVGEEVVDYIFVGGGFIC